MVYAFPLHVWTFLMVFRDFAWVAQRTDVWDAVGLASYALVFALMETVSFFLLMLLLGMLVPRNWSLEKRTVFIGTMGLIIIIWSILCQVYFYLEKPIPAYIITFLVGISHPLRVLWAGMIFLVIFSTGGLAYLITKFEKVVDITLKLFERIVVISAFYVFIDIAGIIIIIIRNFQV